MSKAKKLLPIGSKAYAVSRRFTENNQQNAGAKVVPCKLVTYFNNGGTVIPLYKGGKQELTEEGWHICDSLEAAVRLLTPPVPKKKWKPNDTKGAKTKRSNRRRS